MKSGLHMAFFGSSLVSAYWNGAATYYRGIIRALHQRGHRVTFYEPDVLDRQKHRDMADPDWAEVVVYPAERQADLEPVLKRASRADLIVKASGVGAFDEFLDSAVLQCRRPGVEVVFWDVDAPATLDRLRGNAEDPFHDCVPRYDLILTYGGGQPVVDGYLACGARQCVPIYNALDPTTHYPAPADSRFKADLSFLGNRLPDREARVEEFFLKAASSSPTLEFVLGGSGWQDKPMPGNVRYVGHVPTTNHNAFNCTSRAVLNISRESMARYGFSPATRVFEAAGAAACVITDAWKGIELFLDPGTEVLVAGDGQEVAALVGALSDAQARRMGQAARDRILAEHTYDHRAAQLDGLLRDGHCVQVAPARSPAR